MSKSNKVLDAAEKHTGPRTCPECGFQYPLPLFIKRYVMKFGFPKWACPSCQKLIKYNYFKSNLIGAAVFLGGIFLLKSLESKYGWDMPIFIFMVSYLFLGLILLSFDTLERYKP